MKRVKKGYERKIVSIAMSVFIVGMLVGCGNSEDKSAAIGEAEVVENEEGNTEETTAQAGTTEDCFETEEVIGGVSITGCTSKDSVVIIPETIGEKPVVAIGSQAFFESEYTEICIPDSVKEIGMMCFYGSKNLERIDLGNSVEVIGKMSFSICEKLTTISIPDSVTTMKGFQFGESPNLEEIYVPASVVDIGGSSGCLFNSADCPKAILVTPQGSAAEALAKEYDLPYKNE